MFGTYEGTSLSLSLSFEWNAYQFIELDELILIVCFVFANEVSFAKNTAQSIRIPRYYYQSISILEAKNHRAGSSECGKYFSY